MCARRRTYLLLRRQKKVGKEKATLLSATPFAALRGQPAVLGFSGVSLELATLRFAQTIASPDPLKPALLGAARREGVRAIAALGPQQPRVARLEIRPGIHVLKNTPRTRLRSSLVDPKSPLAAPRSAAFGGSGLAAV